MINPTAEAVIPKAADIDYSNASEVEGYSLYLLKLYELEGGFRIPQQVTRRLKSIEAELRLWCTNVKNLLPEAPLADMYTLIVAYELPHRVVTHHAPPADFMRTLRIKAVQRWATGDKSITATDIALILQPEIYGPGIATLDRKFVQFYFSLIDSWVKELQCSDTFAGTSQAETFTRLRILMTEELYAQYGSKGAAKDKIRWIDLHQVADTSALSTPALRAYIELFSTASMVKGTPLNHQIAETRCLHTALASRTDLHPYTRASLSLPPTSIQELAG